MVPSTEVEGRGRNGFKGNVKSSVRDTVGLRCLRNPHLERSNQQLDRGLEL